MSTLKANKYQHVDRSSPSIEINSDGTVSISSTVTYEDVTSVDSVGVITGRGNVDAKGQVLAGTGVSIAAGGLNVSAGIVTVNDYIQHAGDTNTNIRFPAADTFTVETGGSEAIRVDSSQRLLVGTTASRSANSAQGSFQIEGTGAEDSDMSIIRNQANSGGPAIVLGKSRHASLAGNTVVQDDDQLGALVFVGNDGTDLTSQGARIDAYIDGTPGSNDMPGRLTFSTTADGAASATERLRIDSNGLIANNNRKPSSYGSPNLLISGTDSTLTLMGDGSTNSTSYTGIKFRVAGASTGDYTKAGIFSRREGGYNDLSLIFALDTVADATSVSIADEKMRITSDGIIGIGTASPYTNGLLHCDGNLVLTSSGNAPKIIFDEFSTGTDPKAQIEMDQESSTAASLRFYTEGSGTLSERLRISSGGLVNIGAGSNTAMNGSGLKIYWATYPSLQLQNSTTGTNSTDGSEILLSGDSHSGLFINNRENSIIRFGTNNTERLRIDASGDAGFTGIVTATSFVPTLIQTGHKNIIVNGAMNVAQRGTSDTSDAQGYTTVDRWKISWAGADSIIETHQETLTSSDSGPWQEGFRKSYALVNGNQSSGAGAGDKASIEYRVEAQDIASSGWNYTSSSSYITLSFWIMSTVAQTYQGYLYTFDGTPYKYPFDTGALSANTWKKVTLTIPGASNLTINQDNGEGLLITLWPFIGTDYTASGVTNLTWSTYSGSSRTKDSASTWWTTDNAGFEITGVQLEVGSKATPFEHIRYGDDLARCQRYYEEGGFSFRSSGSIIRYCQPYAVFKRATATVNVYYNSTKQTAGTINSGNSNNSGWSEGGALNFWNMEKNTGSNGDGVDFAGWFTADAEF